MPQVEALADASGIEDAAKQYATEGYGIVRGLFSPAEMAALDEEANRLLERRDLIDTNNLRCRWQQDVETDACVFDAFDPVIDLGPLCAKLANDRRIHELLLAIYGEPGRLFKDK